VTEFAQLVLDGLVSGAVLAIAAVGVSLVYGILRLVNFAHGDYLTFGAYAAFAGTALGLGMVGGTLLAISATALLAIALQLVLWGPLRRRGAGLRSWDRGPVGN